MYNFDGVITMPNNRTVLLLITLATFFASVAWAFLVPLLPSFEKEFNIPHLVSVWIVVASTLGILISIPMGYISDKYGRKPMIVLGMVIISITTLASGFSKTADQLIVFQFILGLGWAAFITSSSAMIGDIFLPEMRAKATSITLIGLFSGTATGFLTAGFLYGSIGWKATFYFLAIIIMAITLIILKVLEDPEKEKITRRGISSLKGNNTVYLCSFILGMVGEGIIIMSPLYMAQQHMSKYDIGILLFAMTIATLMTLPLAGWLADRIGRKKPITYGFLFSVPLLFSFSFVTNSYQLVIILILLGIGTGLGFPAMSAYAQDSASKARGTAMGIYYTSRVAGMAVGPLLGGIIADGVGILVVFNFYAFAALIGALTTVTLLKES